MEDFARKEGLVALCGEGPVEGDAGDVVSKVGECPPMILLGVDSTMPLCND